MAPRPKFNVQNTGFGRKCPLVAIMQSLKPFICTRYSSHLAGRERLDQITNPYLSKDTLLDSHIPVEQNLGILKMHPPDTIRQSKLKRRPKDILFNKTDIKETATTGSPMSSEIICFDQKLSSKLGAEYAPSTYFPIKQYMFNELKKIQLRNLINPIREHFISIENKIIWSKFVIVQSEYESVEQLRILEETQTNTIDFNNFQLDQEEIKQIEQLKPKLLPEEELCLLEENGSENFNSFESLLNTQNTLKKVEITNNWRRKRNRIIRIIFTYFVVFCFVSICYVLIQ